MTEPIVKPTTGEVLPDTLDALTEHERVVDGFLRRLGAHYSYRSRLRERIAELRGPAVLPRPRHRSDRQAAVAACPRCGASAFRTFRKTLT